MGFHRSRSLASALALTALVALGTGCGNKTSPTAAFAPEPQDPVTAEAAHDIAGHFAASLSSKNGVPIDRIGGTTLQGVASSQEAGVLTAGSITDEIGYSWSLSINFYDAIDTQQPAFVPGTTARLTADARARGHLSNAEHQASLGIRRFLDVRGLLPAETELQVDGAANDTASARYAASDGSVTRQYDFLAVGTLEDLRQLKDSSVNPYPLSGVLRYEVKADAVVTNKHGTKEAHYQAKVTVTYNGTRHPTIEVEKQFRYRMDLETGEITELPA